MKKQLLKDLIKISGLTQKKYAEKHEIDYRKLNHWVTGRRNIQDCTLELLAFEDGYKLIIEKKIEYKIEKL